MSPTRSRATVVGSLAVLLYLLAAFLAPGAMAADAAPPPTNVAVGTPNALGFRNVTWKAPSGYPSGPKQYNVRIDDTLVKTVDPTPLNPAYDGMASVSQTTLAGGGNLTVTAVFTDGVESPRSAPVDLTAMNNVPPTNLKLVPSPQGADREQAEWTAPSTHSEEIASYVLRLDDQAMADVPANLGTTTEFNKSMIAAGGKLTVSAKYVSGKESPRSAAVDVSAPPPTPSGALPPTNLTLGGIETTGTQQAKWTAPASRTDEITSYVVRLNEGGVAMVVTGLNGKVNETYVMINQTLLAKGGKLTVTAVYGQGEESPRSNAVDVAQAVNDPGNGNLPDAPLTPNPPTVPGDTTSAPVASVAGNLFGGAIAWPVDPTAPHNNPSARDVYGNSDGFTNLIDTYGTTDFLKPAVNALAVGLWQLTYFLLMSGLAFLAWVLSKSTYKPLASAATAGVSAFGNSELRSILGLAGLIGYNVWGARRIGNANSQIERATGFAVIAISGAILYTTFAATIVPEIVEAPVTLTNWAIIATDSWGVEGDSEADYGLSQTPTYDGDPMQMAVKRHADIVWLQRAYPEYCVLNFGNLDKAIHLKVPDSDPFAGGKSLCEGLLMGQTQHNNDFLDRMRSYSGFGASTGYVETIDPDMWYFYSGQSPWLRVVYALVGLLSELIIAPLNWGLSITVAILVFIMTIDAVLLLIWLTVGAYPPFKEKILGHMKSMTRKAMIPALLAASILVFLKILDGFVSAFGTSGWLVATVVRALFTLILVAYLVSKTIFWIIARVQAAFTAETLSDLGDIGGSDASNNDDVFVVEPSRIELEAPPERLQLTA